MSTQLPERPDIPKPRRSRLSFWTHVAVILAIPGLFALALFWPQFGDDEAVEPPTAEMAEPEIVPEAAAPDEEVVEAPVIEPAPPPPPPPAAVEAARPPLRPGPGIRPPVTIPRDGPTGGVAIDGSEGVAEEGMAEPVIESAGAGTDDLLEIVRVYYGTDRRNEGDAAEPIFQGVRGRELTLGSVDVSVPKAEMHTQGEVERPWNFSFLGFTISGREDPDRHFIIQDVEVLDREAFLLDLRSTIAASEGFEDQALVFVHGFNVTFEAAAYRTAQIAYDLDFDGAPIFYSWPSRGAIGDYEYDQNSARQARTYLDDFLTMVKDESGAETIHLIAHSMGNDPLMEVLARIASRREEDDGPVFNQVILAAPDIDRDVFLDLADRVRGVSDGMTLYASSADRALIASRTYARGIARAGDIPETGPLIVPGIDTIDITTVGAEMLSLNHSEYAENRELLEDIAALLKTGMRPPRQRTPLLSEVELGGEIYWRFPE